MDALQPTVLVIFGITGDLAHKKLLPALYGLSAKNALPKDFSIIGFARRPWDNNQLRQEARKALQKENIPIDSQSWNKFSNKLTYIQSDFDNEEGYERLAQQLNQKEHLTKLYYFATPPSSFATIIDQIKKAALHKGCSNHQRTCTRVIVEKPFGHDLASARRLHKLFLDTFTEDQMYRIDHYLGKETVQNILAFRFGNAIFEPIWNKEYIDSVQITAAETVGIETRGAFYEETGALRDFFQNHLLQLVAAVASEPPRDLSPQAIRNERVKTLQALEQITDVRHATVRGQYIGYRQENNVLPESEVETYVAAKLFIKSNRFKNVPFYLRTGKKLKEKVTDITIQFKPEKNPLFQMKQGDDIANTISIRIQPNEGISIRLFTKQPGQRTTLVPVQMDFCYQIAFGGPGDDAYARLLLDAILGDQTLFACSAEIEAAWQFVTPILETWQKNQQPVYQYNSGTWGPKESDELIKKDKRKWLAQQVIVCKI